MEERVCIFGGSFDPIHIGHAMMANYVSQLDCVDALWIMPGKVNPLKTERPPAAQEDRLEMCRLVASRCEDVSVCELELHLPSPSYTWRTLNELRERFPDKRFSLLIGSDNWLCFDRWKCHDRIVDDFDIIIYPRPGYDVDESSLPVRVTLLESAPQALISSTFIREGLAAARNMNYFLPQEVLNYINQHNLYG